LDISYETVRRWFLKFGTPIAANLCCTRPTPSDHWHLDEMVIVIRRRRYWLWRAVDNEGEVLDFLVQRKRDAKAAKKIMRKTAQEARLRANPDRDGQTSVLNGSTLVYMVELAPIQI
jgi:putative transposase